jgi:glutamate transport system substrate-binding protein
MADDELGGHERLQQTLQRYAARVQPAQDQWARIEGRHAAVARRPTPRRTAGSLAATAGLAVVAVLLAGMLGRPDQTRLAVAGPFVGPDVPQYAGVFDVPEWPAGSTMAAIQARGFIRVGIKFDQPSFGQIDADTEQVEGFDAEIAKLMAVAIFGGKASDVDHRIRWVQAVSRNRESLLAGGEVDIVIATYSITAERAERVSFAGPYYSSRQDIMFRSDDTSIAGLDDLVGKRVCTAQGSTSYQNLVTASPDAVPVIRDTYSECAQALADEKVDAVTTDRAILAGYLHQGSGTFRLLNRPFADEELYGIGLRKYDEGFRRFLTQRLIDIVANGDWSQAARYSISNLEPLPPEIANS